MADKCMHNNSCQSLVLPSFDPQQLKKANQNSMFTVPTNDDEDLGGILSHSQKFSQQDHALKESKSGYTPSRVKRSHAKSLSSVFNKDDRQRMSVEARELGQRWSEAAFDRASIEQRQADKRVITNFTKLRGVHEGSDEFL